MFYPNLNEVKKMKQDFKLIPITLEVFADMETPISLFKRFEESNNCFLLESVEGGEKWARYSFIGRNPFLIVTSYNEKNNAKASTKTNAKTSEKTNTNSKTIIKHRDGTVQEVEGNPVEIIHNLMKEYTSPMLEGVPRFNGGAVGFLGYDTARYFEKLPNVPEDDLLLPESQFMFADEVITFDHLKQKIHITVNMHMGGNTERSYNSAVDRIKEIYREVLASRWKISDTYKGDFIRHTQLSNALASQSQKITTNVSKEQFCENVKKAKQYIIDGDIFQVVLSQRLCVETEQKSFDVYRALRLINPSPYMYYLKFDDYTIAGASPEMLARVVDGKVETCPIAGTRKRGVDEQQDADLEAELLADEKEIAEHMMLVDLARNDVGRVSSFGSVKVTQLKKIEKYSHVMHIVSNVQGEIRKDKTPFDALMSVLPAGTLSGAPKIRAMEIIDELENVKRGPYGGAIAYFSFNGNVDSCITIRTMVFKDRKAYVQAGAGIVADSVPEAEYEESINKAMAMLKALEKVGEIV